MLSADGMDIAESIGTFPEWFLHLEAFFNRIQALRLFMELLGSRVLCFISNRTMITRLSCVLIPFVLVPVSKYRSKFESRFQIKIFANGG